MIHQQINTGDVVLLVFNERGLEKFKVRWGQLSDPTMDGFFSERDALGYPLGRREYLRR